MPFQNCRRQPIAATPFNEPQGVSLCASDTGTEDLVIELDPESHFGPAFPFCRGQRAIAWWRWEHEADPAQYREHCIRVTELPDF